MKFLVRGILALAILSPWTPPVQAAAAARASAEVQVRATIRPWIRFSAQQPISRYRVTSADIRRGYIDFPRALTLSVQTNIHDSVRFEITSGGPERILVDDGGAGFTDAVRIDSPGPAEPVTRTLDMRIVLPDGVREGTFPLLIATSPVAF